MNAHADTHLRTHAHAHAHTHFQMHTIPSSPCLPYLCNIGVCFYPLLSITFSSSQYITFTFFNASCHRSVSSAAAGTLCQRRVRSPSQTDWSGRDAAHFVSGSTSQRTGQQDRNQRWPLAIDRNGENMRAMGGRGEALVVCVHWVIFPGINKKFMPVI